MDEERIGDYVVHSVAAIFPLLEGKDYDELKISLQDIGQQQPIILKGRELLDGRNRLKALLELGIPPVFQEYTGPLSPEEYILAANLFRRHLSDDQRAMIATDLMRWKESQEAEARKATGKSADGTAGGRGRKNLTQNSEQGLADRNARSTVGKIAANAKVGRHKAEQATNVANNAPELVEAVKRGDIPLREADKKARDRRPPRHNKPAPKPPAPTPPTPDFDREAVRVVKEIGRIAFHFYMDVCSSDQQKAEFKRRVLQELANNCWGAEAAASASSAI